MLNDKGLTAPYLTSSLVNIFEPENKSQFRIIKDLNSTEMNDFPTNEGKPVTLFSKMLTFRNSNQSFRLDGDLLETMTFYDFNVSLSNPEDQKVSYDFGKEMNFNMKQRGRKVTEIDHLKIIKITSYHGFRFFRNDILIIRS